MRDGRYGHLLPCSAVSALAACHRTHAGSLLPACCLSQPPVAAVCALRNPALPAQLLVCGMDVRRPQRACVALLGRQRSCCTPPLSCQIEDGEALQQTVALHWQRFRLVCTGASIFSACHSAAFFLRSVFCQRPDFQCSNFPHSTQQLVCISC